IFQAVDLDLVHDGEHLAEFSFRKPLLRKPNDVRFGKIHKAHVLIAAERHAVVGEPTHFFAVGGVGYLQRGQVVLRHGFLIGLVVSMALQRPQTMAHSWLKPSTEIHFRRYSLSTSV